MDKNVSKSYITRHEIYIWRLALAFLVVNGNVTMHDMLRLKFLRMMVHKRFHLNDYA